MSEKNRDDKNRWRNVTIAFRMSPDTVPAEPAKD